MLLYELARELCHAGVIARIAPRRILTYGVGAVVLLSAGYQALRLFGVI